MTSKCLHLLIYKIMENQLKAPLTMLSPIFRVLGIVSRHILSQFWDRISPGLNAALSSLNKAKKKYLK